MKKKIMSVSLCLVMITSVLIGFAATTGAGDWPMADYDECRTKNTDTEVPATLALQWKYDYVGIAGKPVVVDEKVYFYLDTDPGYSTECLNAETGEFIWSHPKGSTGTPLVAENMVYIGDDATDNLCCLDAEGNGDGTTDELWSCPTSMAPNSPVIYDGYLYMWGAYCIDADPTDDGIDEGFDDPDGAEYDIVWHHSFGGIVIGPSVANDNVYYCSLNTVYCLDATGNGDGTTDLIWEYGLEGSNSVQRPVLYDNKVYVAKSKVSTPDQIGLLYCIDAIGNGDGTTDLLWSFETDITNYDPSIANEKVYLASSSTTQEHLYCLDPDGNGDETTNVIWTETRAGRTSPIIAHGVVYVGGIDQSYYGFSASTGNTMWDYAHENDTLQLNSPVVVAEVNGQGRLFIKYTGITENNIHYPDSLYCLGNQPPAIPTIDGPIEGGIGERLTFSAITTDPEEDDIHYCFNWGDDTDSHWIAAIESNTTVYEGNIWAEAGEYQVRVKAKDVSGGESDWSEPITVDIGQLSIGVSGGFGVGATITNSGSISKQINYTIDVLGGSFPGLHIKRHWNDDDILLKPGASYSMRTGPFFCLGSVDIVVTAECDGDPVISKTVEGFVFFFYVTLQEIKPPFFLF